MPAFSKNNGEGGMCPVATVPVIFHSFMTIFSIIVMKAPAIISVFITSFIIILVPVSAILPVCLVIVLVTTVVWRWSITAAIILLVSW